MKKYKGKSLSNTISSIGSMLIFLLFAICMLLIIAAAAGSYSRISDNYGSTFGASASLRYISNKIKSSDSAEAAEKGFILKSDGITNVIYFKDGILYEKTMFSDDEPTLSGGEKLFSLENLEITETDGLYKITVISGSEKQTALIGKG